MSNVYSGHREESVCDYRLGEHHRRNALHGFWCHSIAEDALESGLHQWLTVRCRP